MSKTSYILVVVISTILIVRAQEFEEQALLSYHKCLLDSDCQRISNTSFCYGNDQGQTGKCKCIDGYELMSRNTSFFACLKDAGYGEPCEKNIQCQIPLSVNAICDPVENTCRCADFAHRYTDGRCYMSALLEEYCQNDGNCYMKDGTFGNCIAGRCSCKFDRQVPAEDKMSCIETRELEEKCDNDEQCGITPYAVCRITCQCATGYILSRNRENCVKAATMFFEECIEDEQCTQFLVGSYCNGGNCTCSDDQHGYGSRCVRSAQIGGVCTNLEECIPDSSYAESIKCVEGTCQCQPGFVNEALGCNAAEKMLASIFSFGFCVFFSLIYFQIAQ